MGEYLLSQMIQKLSLVAIAVFAVALTLIGLANDAEAAAYLKFDGIDGEAKDRNHQNWSDLMSFQQTISRDTTTSSGAARARAGAVFEDLVVTKTLDKSSPKIAESIAMGKVFPKVEIHLTSNAGTTYYSYELTNVMVTSYSVGGSADDIPTEQISLNFEEIKVTYAESDTTGKSKGNVEYSWKIEEGTK